MRCLGAMCPQAEKREEHDEGKEYDIEIQRVDKGAAQSTTDIGKLMHDMRCRDAAEMYFEILKKRVSQFKNSEEGRRIMCKAVEEFAERRAAESKAEGIAEGKREGKRENMLATAKRMLKDGILALKDVARYTGLSLAQVTQLKASM